MPEGQAACKAIHPAAKLFPLMQGQEFSALVEDIRTNGQRFPILLLDGQVLDGRNRLRACEAAGVAPRFEDVRLGGRSPASFVWSANAKRRHLEVAAMVLIKKRVLAMEEAWQAEHSPEAVQQKANQKRSEAATRRPRRPDGTMSSGGSRDPSVAKKDGHARRKAVAEECNASPGTVARVERLEREAPKLAELVAAGRLSFSDSKRLAVLPEAEQLRGADAVQAGEAKDAKVLAPDHGFNGERSQRAENGGRP